MKDSLINLIMYPLVILSAFGVFVFFLILMFIVFIPVLPIMVLAFPMQFLNEGTGKIHWTQKPYLWYFNHVWLKLLALIDIKK